MIRVGLTIGKSARFNPILTLRGHGRPMKVGAQREVLDAVNARAKAAGWTFVCGLAHDFTHPALNAALALWRDKAAGRAMPLRSEMTARAMKPFMPNMSLLERIDSGASRRYRVRLHGSALARYSGDNTGRFLDDFVAPERMGGYLGIYDAVLQLQIPLRVVSHYQAPEIDYLTGESLVAPLAVPGSNTPVILSVTYARARGDLRSISLGHRVA